MIKLDVTVDHTGGFIKAFVDGERISQDEFYTLIGIKALNGARVEYYLDKFKLNHQEFEIDVWEKDVR